VAGVPLDSEPLFPSSPLLFRHKWIRTLGPIGRSAEGHIGASRAGTAATITISFCRGVDIGVSFDGGIVGPRHSINKEFYGNEYSDASQIVNGSISFPSHKNTVFTELKAKLMQKSSPANQTITHQKEFLGRPKIERVLSSPKSIQQNLPPMESTTTDDDSSGPVFISRTPCRHLAIRARHRHREKSISKDGLHSDAKSNRSYNKLATENISNNKENQQRYGKHQPQWNSMESEQQQRPWKDDHEESLPKAEGKTTSAEEVDYCTFALQEVLPWGMRVWSV
jgi:hypothetical protein